MSDLLDGLTTYFGYIFEFFKIDFPGTTFSFFEISVCVLLTTFVIGISHRLNEFTTEKYRSGNVANVKISQARKYDTK